MKCPKCQADNSDLSHFCADCGTQLLPLGDLDVSKTVTSPPDRKTFAKGTTVAGKYVVLGDLGKGGMGEVYLAEDTSLDRKVALKFLPEETYQDPAARGRFLREAKAAAALDHPYICSIHEVGESENRLFIAMEYVEGRTLQDKISQGPLPLKQTLQIAAEIAEALQVAHDKGMIHRDIKPANIMLMEKGHAKVMDFGLAKQVWRPEDEQAQATRSMTQTAEGRTPGTLAYMSPEQLQGQPLDGRSDIFSFGVVLYEMLGGIHPFKKGTGLTTANAILNENPRPLVGLIKGMPDPLQQVLNRLLAKDPGERYPSMKDVHADLKKMLSDLPSALKALKFLKPVRVVAAAAVLVVAVVAAAWLAKFLFFKTPAKALAFQERDWILITDFDNQTGDPVFDGSLETALTVSIQQSQYVNVFPATRIQETLKRMRRTDVKRIDETVGREVALREGIKGLLACSISKIGNDYLLTAKIVDPDKQTSVFSDSSRTKGKDGVLGNLDKLAEKVRHGLGESMPKITRQRLALDRATTSSLEALKYYSATRRAPPDTAAQLLKQAIDLDPDFALAHAELGMKYYIGGDRVKGEEHFQKALSLLDRLTTREKLWIRALVEDWRGNRDQGIQNYKAYVAQYPDDAAAWFRLGYAYLITNQPGLGIEAFKRMIEIDKGSAAAYSNMAACYNMLDKNDEALANYQKAFSLNPNLATGFFEHQEYGFLLVRMGKIEEARRAFENMIAQVDNYKKARGYRSLANLEMYQGRYSAAQDNLREAIILNKTLKAKLSEMRDHLFLAMAFRMKRQYEAFDKEMAAITKIRKEINIEPSFLFKVGKVFARLNRLKEANEVLDSLKSRVGDILAQSGISRSNQLDQASFHMLKAEIELAKGQFEEAVNSYEMAASLRGDMVDDGLAYAYLKIGNLDKAIEKYSAFLQAATDVLGYEGQELWILSHYQLGMLYERKGDLAEAAKYYERFLEIWKDADPGIPEVEDARKRLAGLKGQ
jgi:serine/threonine protein kinase/tetratricopeptide (TPR) repeat protein